MRPFRICFVTEFMKFLCAAGSLQLMLYDLRSLISLALAAMVYVLGGGGVIHYLYYLCHG
jgi:hypothetical protein